jgi:hypothetical protein
LTKRLKKTYRSHISAHGVLFVVNGEELAATTVASGCTIVKT